MIKFDEAAWYRITIQGELDERTFELIGGADQIVLENGIEKMTTVTVFVQDQARLSGILNIIYDCRYTLLQISCLDEIEREI